MFPSVVLGPGAQLQKPGPDRLKADAVDRQLQPHPRLRSAALLCLLVFFSLMPHSD